MRVSRHVFLPLLAPLAIVGLYVTPVELIGCLHRGLLAVAVALASAIGSIVASGAAIRGVRRGRAEARWWLVTALVLILPMALLVGPLG